MDCILRTVLMLVQLFKPQAQVQQQQAMAMMQGWAPLGVPPYMGMPSMSMGASKPSQTEGAIFQSTAAFNQLPTPFAQPPPLPPHVGGAMSAAAGQEAIEVNSPGKLKQTNLLTQFNLPQPTDSFHLINTGGIPSLAARECDATAVQRGGRSAGWRR